MKEEFFDLTQSEDDTAEGQINETSDKDHLVVGYKENTDINAEEPEPKEEESEEPQKETSDEKGRNPDDEPYWQSKYDKEIAPLKQQVEQLQKNAQPKEIEDKPPIKPNTDDPLEIQDYLASKIEYQEKIIGKMVQATEAERNQRIQAENAAKERAYVLGQLIEGGAEPDEANKILEDFVSMQRNPQEYSKFIVNSWRNKSQPKKTSQDKTSRQNQVKPLGATTSESEVVKSDPDNEFFGDLQSTINKYY